MPQIVHDMICPVVGVVGELAITMVSKSVRGLYDKKTLGVIELHKRVS